MLCDCPFCVAEAAEGLVAQVLGARSDEKKIKAVADAMSDAANGLSVPDLLVALGAVMTVFGQAAIPECPKAFAGAVAVISMRTIDAMAPPGEGDAVH